MRTRHTVSNPSEIACLFLPVCVCRCHISLKWFVCTSRCASFKTTHIQKSVQKENSNLRVDVFVTLQCVTFLLPFLCFSFSHFSAAEVCNRGERWSCEKLHLKFSLYQTFSFHQYENCSTSDKSQYFILNKLNTVCKDVNSILSSLHTH